MTDRELLQRALDSLTAQGYEAHARFMCCMSCGLAALREETTHYVFWHEQDDMHAFSINPDAWQYGLTPEWVRSQYWDDNDKETWEEPEDAWTQYTTIQQPLHLRWGGDAEVIQQAFREQGFATGWSGKENQTILVLPRR